MTCTKGCICIALFLGSVLLSPALWAQTNCEEGDGPLRADQPQGMTAEQIIQRFAAKEAVFKQARDNYTYTQDITVQTLDGSTIDGEFREVAEIMYDDKGNRRTNVTYAPQSTLTHVSVVQEDLDNLRRKEFFVLSTLDLPQYDILYVGIQHVDDIDTYVFDVAPKRIKSDRRYFQGRIWVDDKDFQVVKSCGKTISGIGSNKNNTLNPRFVTYRELVDGQYWFPTYSRADDVVHFSKQDVHIREVIRYTNYKRWGSHTKIRFSPGATEDSPKWEEQ